MFVALLLFLGWGWFEQPIKIDVAHDTERERETRSLLDQVLVSYDLSRYAFTRHVVIEERPNKGHYTWIYKTVLQDEARIAAVVRKHHLDYRAHD
jgi:hypothetical protein